MSLCLARNNTQAGSKGGFLEVTLDPIVNKSGALHGLHSSCWDVAGGVSAAADGAQRGSNESFHPYCPDL